MANAFINAWKKKNPEGKIDTLNVWEMDLLPFEGPALDAKYAVIEGKTMTAEHVAVWEQVAALGRRFHRADLTQSLVNESELSRDFNREIV